MKKYLFLAILSIFLFNESIGQSDLWTKGKAIHPMDDWMRDPYIVIGPDSLYYLTATQYLPSSENIKQPVYKSADLTNWVFEGFFYSLKDASHYETLVERAAQSNSPGIRKDGLKLWAPEIHFINNRWVIVHTTNVGLGNFVVAAEGKEMKKEFTDWGEDFGKNHDPSLFVDGNDIWLVAGCTYIQQVKPDLSGFMGERIPISPSNRKMGHEGTYIRKINDKYVLFGTAWSTDSLRHGTYNLYYCTADNLEGPYGERKFAGRFLGHGTPFKDKQGNWWCTAFFNANKPAMTPAEIKKIDASDNAYTINKQGLTLVPMDITEVNGEIVVKPKDPDYQLPGKEETQKFK